MTPKILMPLALLLLSAGPLYAADATGQRYDQTFVYCRDVDGYLVTPPEWKQPQAAPQSSASNDFSPLPEALLRQLRVKGNVLTPATIQKLGLTVQTLRQPQHGRVQDLTPPDQRYETHLPGGKTATLPAGTTSFGYTLMPDLGYLGQDQAVYEVRANGKHYKVVVNFLVVTAVRDGGPSQCSAEKFKD